MKKDKKIIEQEKDLIFEPLDEEEVEYMTITEPDDYELKSIPNLEEEKKRYASYAKHTLEQKNKKKKITVNLFERDLKLLKAKADQLGLPYQTYLASLVHQITEKDFEI